MTRLLETPRMRKFWSLDQPVGKHAGRRLFSGRATTAADRLHRIRLIVGGVAALAAVAAFGVAPFAPDIADQPVTRVTQAVTLPELAAHEEAAPTSYIQEVRVAKGDTIASLMERLGVQDPAAVAFTGRDAIARELLKVRPGKTVSASTDDEGELLWLRAMLSADEPNARMLFIERRDDGTLQARQVVEAYERRVVMRNATIQSSLFAAADAAQIPDAITQQMVDLLSGDIDFYNDLRRGDSFEVVYEQLALPTGEVVRSGQLLAIRFINAGRKHQALWFDADGPEGHKGAFYAFDGRSLKKAFLKTPVEFTRISSGFGNRNHPIFGYSHRHTGIDVAAPHGTGVRAASDGTVEFAGWQRGYGNTVIIRHAGVHSTLYAHLSGFQRGLRKGQRVTQGDIIGFVGSTGNSTGPHLHYELHVNGAPVNPQTAILPDAQPIAANLMPAFRAHAGEMGRRLALAGGREYAQAE
jgi:murein DD-endopeptidase MepM/ murein hydrolase activator NlpD